VIFGTSRRRTPKLATLLFPGSQFSRPDQGKEERLTRHQEAVRTLLLSGLIGHLVGGSSPPRGAKFLQKVA